VTCYVLDLSGRYRQVGLVPDEETAARWRAGDTVEMQTWPEQGELAVTETRSREVRELSAWCPNLEHDWWDPETIAMLAGQSVRVTGAGHDWTKPTGAKATVMMAEPDGPDGISLTLAVSGSVAAVAALPDPWRVSLGYLWRNPQVDAVGRRSGGRVELLDVSSLEQEPAVGGQEVTGARHVEVSGMSLAVSEGFCPLPGHGPLGKWGRCAACMGPYAGKGLSVSWDASKFGVAVRVRHVSGDTVYVKKYGWLDRDGFTTSDDVIWHVVGLLAADVLAAASR
jgi:hypothetical protein